MLGLNPSGCKALSNTVALYDPQFRETDEHTVAAVHDIKGKNA